jgi:hypothetical protein
MLTKEEVKIKIDAGRPSWITTAEAESVKYNVHFNGVGVAEYLERQQEFENERVFKARKDLVTSNRYLFENLTRPIDKVFSATGGNNVYPKNSKKILTAIKDVRHGYSIKKWIQNIHAGQYYTDPNGLIFFEWETKNTYPTVKSISSIFNYESSGRNVNWIIFQPKKIDKGLQWRVVDEKWDYTYNQYNEELVLVEEKTYPNKFGKCPAIVNSDIIHFELDRKDSPFAPVIELADHYLRTGSVKNIYENYHGYPIFWAYVEPCRVCEGTGLTNGETCHHCDGEKHTFKKDVTDVIKLHPPKSTDQPQLAPDVAGYIQPDLETWREQRTELDWLWHNIFFVIWGTTYQRDQQTATATWIDAQPVNERLTQFSESFEDVEQKMTELIGIFYNNSSNDISINWGKRFMIESPDVIWEKYIKAKEKGAPKTTLDYLLTQFYQTEYSNDKESLVISEKLIKLEPFIHLTEKQVKENGVTGYDFYAKLYFNEWVKTLDSGYVFVTDINKLRTEFEVYINKKIEKNGTEKTQGISNQEPDGRGPFVQQRGDETGGFPN